MNNILILGDSISTFEGSIPREYEHYYSENVIKNTDVCSLEHMWWSEVAKRTGSDILLNSSYSGTTVCNTGYGGEDARDKSFVGRLDALCKDGFFKENTVDTVFVFGGTNDFWAGSPMGEQKYSNWEREDLFCVLPAFSYMLYTLSQNAPDARIVCIVNEGLGEEITEGFGKSCDVFGADCIVLSHIETVDGHPNKEGMRAIAQQVLSCLEKKKKKSLGERIKSAFAPTDMTRGSVWKSIVAFTLPMLIGNIAQQLYSTVDTIVVGHYADNGDEAIAAVGSALPILNMLLVLFIGISAGASVMVAQYFGAKNRRDLSYTVGNCITVTAIACVLLIGIATPFIPTVLDILNTPEAIKSQCADYLTISLIGIAGMAYYNILSGVIRGLGDSVSALVYLLVATGINIVLDIYFVKELRMNVAGVALATVISQLISSGLCLVKLSRMRKHFDFGLRYLKPKKQYVKTIVKLGLPSGLTQAIFSMAMIIVQSLTNSFGAQFIAANVVIMRVDGFAMMPNFSFGTALTTFAGQNVGAGKYDRVEKGAKQGTLIALGCSAVITAAILLFGKSLMGVFTDTKELVDMSYYLMTILATGYLAVAITQSLSGIMRGAGDTMTPMWISLISTIALRVPLAYGLSYLTRTPELPFGNFECIQISLLVSWIMGAVLTMIFYKRGAWRQKRL